MTMKQPGRTPADLAAMRDYLRACTYLTAFPALIILALISAGHEYQADPRRLQMIVILCILALGAGCFLYNWLLDAVRVTADEYLENTLNGRVPIIAAGVYMSTLVPALFLIPGLIAPTH